jgi:glycosyltransferase involved in cell wall biosynthesis
MAELLDDERPDLVQSDFHSLPYAAAACRRQGVPLLFMCWGWWFRPRPWQRRFYRRSVARVVAASWSIREGFLGRPAAIAPEQVAVVSPGVDVDRFRPPASERALLRAALGLPAAGPLVTLLARYQEVKGHDVFLAAAREVGRQMPEVTFAVAGDEPFGVAADAAYGRRVRSIAASDPLLASRVRFLGRTDAPERLLAASDVLVCSSRFETFGMAVVEAMSCEVPVVSTNRGGPAETVVHGETGLLVPPDRPDLIASGVLDLLADAGLRRRMGRAGRQRVETLFSVEGYAARFTDLALAIARPDASSRA